MQVSCGSLREQGAASFGVTVSCYLEGITLDSPGGYVARMIVEVMLKPEIHDPQGEAIASACHRLGFGQVLGVRQGKRFEVELDGPADDAAVTAITKLARDLLSNPVIEDFSLRAE